MRLPKRMPSTCLRSFGRWGAPSRRPAMRLWTRPLTRRGPARRPPSLWRTEAAGSCRRPPAGRVPGCWSSGIPRRTPRSGLMRFPRPSRVSWSGLGAARSVWGSVRSCRNRSGSCRASSQPGISVTCWSSARRNSRSFWGCARWARPRMTGRYRL